MNAGQMADVGASPAGRKRRARMAHRMSRARPLDHFRAFAHGGRPGDRHRATALETPRSADRLGLAGPLDMLKPYRTYSLRCRRGAPALESVALKARSVARASRTLVSAALLIVGPRCVPSPSCSKPSVSLGVFRCAASCSLPRNPGRPRPRAPLCFAAPRSRSPCLDKVTARRVGALLRAKCGVRTRASQSAQRRSKGAHPRRLQAVFVRRSSRSGPSLRTDRAGATSR